MSSMLIDQSPFKKLPQKRLFEHTGFQQGCFSMNFKRVNAGGATHSPPQVCKEMKFIDVFGVVQLEPSRIDEPETTEIPEIRSPPGAVEMAELAEVDNLESSFQPQPIARKYPPPKERKGIPVLRIFPRILQKQNQVSYSKSGVEGILPLLDTKERDGEQIKEEIAEEVQAEAINVVGNERSKLVHGEIPSELELWKKYELLRANESKPAEEKSLIHAVEATKQSVDTFCHDAEKHILEAKESKKLSIVSFDDYWALVARMKVREALNLFQELHKILSHEDKMKSNGKGKNAVKIISDAAMLLKQHQKWVNTNERYIGPLPGVVVGDQFQFRAELCIIGLHQQFNSGIDYVKKDGTTFATSIVSSGRYANETESSDVLIYSGQGGNPKIGSKEPEDQKLERGNLALKNSMDARTPVRVIRSSRTRKASSTNSKKRVQKIYIYDGLYTVSKSWKERGQYGKLVFKYELNRIPGQPKLTPVKVSSRPGKTKLDHARCVVDDISQGKEKLPIRAMNAIDDEKPTPFSYMTDMIYPNFYGSSIPRSCDCADGCSDFVQCCCVVKNGGEIPFNDDGAIVTPKPVIYECGPFCKCSPSCKNRVSQRGIRYQLEIFKTQKRGWGVRSQNFIPSGSFICEYVGEILGDHEADDRAGVDEYLFDIGNNYSNYVFGQGVDSFQGTNDNYFAIDAAHFGNIGRFINHSCSPNLYAQDVFYDHDDKRLPHIMLFATENIPPLQELNYDYNYKIDQVYDANGNIKRKDCYCGARDCTGRLY